MKIDATTSFYRQTLSAGDAVRLIDQEGYVMLNYIYEYLWSTNNSA